MGSILHVDLCTLQLFAHSNKEDAHEYESIYLSTKTNDQIFKI